MRRLIILDSGPLGMVAKAPGRPDAARCIAWVKALSLAGTVVAVPKIARYEVRRELFRTRATAGLRRLDHLHPALDFLPITSVIMDMASELWAHVRQGGLSTADDKAIDGDAIVAATALFAAEPGVEVIIATENVDHLARFPGVEAREWWTIVS